ncbi:hypothetical protein PMAYCL1PPCAC_24315 [Pristionchus mayeri]|uniref:Transcriptional repressor p66 coiled-coil MBD2-interaction domain-containing protein n=1 Tax=Pristionchus mayeri TaxID=1317129 RepID=A0AAN5I7J7_9BILA|nr:hypothetical protein PMAYCL1PPCAC_24315 [Pristionchus mayeri]
MENGTAVATLNGGTTTPMMMDTTTAGEEEMNGLDLSTKSISTAAAAAAPGPISLNTSSSNGSTEGTPTPGTPINGSPEKGLEAGQISPSSLRRSTRASAIKAQQKIKDGDVPQAMEQEKSVESEEESAEDEKKDGIDGESAAKKRKLENGKALDQFSHEFSIKMEEDGGVYMLDEGSELSSLNETEIETLKKCYDKLLARELTTEQKEERTRMIKQAEADLRNEEAKLTMIKKMRASQIPKPNPVSDLQRKLAANVAANSTGAAYKPPVAGAAAAAKNSGLAGNAAATAFAQLLSGKSGPQAQAQLLTLLQNSMSQMTPQQKEMMARMGSLGTAQLLAAVAMQQQQKSGQPMTKEQQQLLSAALIQQSNRNAAASSSTAAASAATAAAAAATAPSNNGTSTPTVSSATASSSSSAAMAAAAAASSGAVSRLDNVTTAQKLAAARHAFRKTADNQLISTAMPKACPNELFFIPNPNTPDFLSMLGLDQVVGRILKDKNATRNVSERPYECEECGCDFATGWKCIGTKEDDLHLYCEGCLRQAQKKKLRHDRNAQLKKIYAKVALQEKEFEKQISDGKLDGMLASVFAQLQGQSGTVAAAAARPTAAASPAVQNLSTKPSTPSVPSPAMQKPATPLQSTPSGSKTTSTVNSSSGTKRPATGGNQQQLQTQLAQLAQLARANPMMAAAMMSGGMSGLMGNMGNQAQAQAAAMMSYAPMLQQMHQMQQLQARMQQASNSSNSSAAKASTSSSSAAASSSSNNNAAQSMAMNMLAQAMHNANRSGTSNSSNANALAMAQLAALSQQNVLNNPQLLRQMQQLAAAQMQKNASKK